MVAGKLTPLIVIVGETASGKTDLSVYLAQKFNGEIICADSRTVYKGADIGTAKPSQPVRQEITHHLLDVVDPDQSFTVADFKLLANNAIEHIAANRRLPIMVGGSGMYVDSVLFDYEFRPKTNKKLRKKLENLSVEELQHRIKKKQLFMPRNDKNPRHLIRTLETDGYVPSSKNIRPNTLVLGLYINKEILKQRVSKRVEAMFAVGLVEETRRLSRKYGWQPQVLQAPGYKELRQYIERDSDLQEAKQSIIRNHLQLAKKQHTWFKRNKSIHWIDDPMKSVDIITTFLNKIQL